MTTGPPARLLRVIAASQDANWLAALPGILAAADFRAEITAVSEPAAFEGALRAARFEVALCDGSCTRWSVAAAAEILRRIRLHPPLIFVADAPGENAVAAALRAGAADYVSQREPLRMGPAILGAIAAEKLRHQEREAANHYRMLVEDAQVGIYLIQENRVIYANPRFAEIFGYAREELLAMPHLEHLVIPEDRKLVAQNIHRRESGEVRALRYGFRGLRKDCQPVEVEVYGVATRACGTSAILGTLLDVTPQRRVDRELQQSIALLRAVLEGSSEGMLALNHDGVILASNRRFAELWHISDEVMAGGDDAAIFARVLDQLVSPEEFMRGFGGIAAGEPAPPPARLWLKGGRILERSANLFSTPGAGEGQVFSFREVTDTLRLADDLQRSEARLRAVLQNASDIITLIDREGKILYESPVIQRILGYDADELSGQSLFAHLHPDDHSRARENIAALIATPGESRTASVRYRSKDGNWIWLESIAVNRLTDPEIAAIVISSRDIHERMQFVNALRDSEARFKLFMDNFPGLAFIKDDEGKMLYVNAGLARFFAAAPADLIGRSDVDLMGTDAAARIREQDAQVMASGEASRLELGISGADGARHAMMVLKFPLMLTPAKRLLGGIALDISEREQMAAALRDSEERFRLFMDTNPALAFIKDENGRYTYVNRPYEEFFGQPPGAWIGRRDEEMLPAAIAAQFRGNDAEVMAASEAREYSETTADSEGRVRTSMVLKFPFRDGGGRLFVGGMAFDVTERRRTEQALQESEEHFRLLVEDSLTGVYLFQNRKFIYVNPRLCEILGYSAEELYALPDLIVLTVPEDRDLVREQVGKRLSDDPVGKRYTVRNIRKDGRRINVELHGSRVMVGGQPAILGSLTDITERQSAETALRESETRFRSLVQNSFDVVDMLDTEGRITFMAPSSLRILGYTPEEMTGASLFDLYHPDDHHIVQAAMESLLARPDEMVQILCRFRHKDGHWIDLESRGLNLLNVPGINAIVANSRDRGEEVRVQRALEQSEARLGSLVRNSYDLITLLSPQGEMLYHSPALARIIGFSPEELAGRSQMEFVHTDDRESLLAKTMELVQFPDRRLQALWRCRHKDGQWIWLESVGTNLLADPAVAALVINSRDITERRAAEEGLARALQRLRLHIENAPLAVIEWSRESRVIAWNPAAERMFGYPAHAAAGRDAEFIATDASRAQIAEMFAQMLRREGAGDSPVLEHRTGDGRLIQCHWFNTPLINREGEVFAIASLIQDVSELIRTRRELEEFIFTTAHDLKAPLLSVKAFAQLASRAAAGQSALESPLARVIGNARRMETLVSGVLEYARLGYRDRRDEWIALEPLTRALLAAAIPPDDDAVIELVGRDRPAHELLMDPRDYERLITNLLGNARNYRDPRRPLRITLGVVKGENAHAGFYAISVADNGAGIAPEQHQYIFRMFTRLGGESTDGHGLGLAIVKRLTEDYGGRITVESLGQGTRFNLWLPVSRFRRADKAGDAGSN